MRRGVFPAQQEKTMKPNGKMIAVRMTLFAVCAVCLLSDLSKAETVRGTFQLPVATHWGRILLTPGKYEFVVDTGSATRVVTVTSKDTGWSGMILAAAVDETSMSSGSEMKLAKFDNTTYVETLSLKDAGVAWRFSVPRPVTKLAKAASSNIASSSGTN
jgi:hypothetical protein